MVSGGTGLLCTGLAGHLSNSQFSSVGIKGMARTEVTEKGCGLWTLSCDFVHHFLLKH